MSVTFVVRDSDVLLATRWLRNSSGPWSLAFSRSGWCTIGEKSGHFGYQSSLQGSPSCCSCTRNEVLDAGYDVVFRGLVCGLDHREDTFDLQERILLTVLLG